MNEEFAWLRPILLSCTLAFVLGLIIHVCRDAAERRAGFEAAIAADLSAQRTNANGFPIYHSQHYRIVPAHALPATVPNPEFE